MPTAMPKVVLLCGGLGTRMNEETEFKPKPLVEVGGRPLLWHIMKTYEAAGYTEFICCLGYRGKMIKQYFLDYRASSRDFEIDTATGDFELLNNHLEAWKVALIDTGLETQTGGRVKQVAPYLGESDIFLCTYGDGLANIDIDDLVRFHRSHGRLATLTGVNRPSQFGELVTEGKEIRQFTEKPDNAGLISGGYFVFDRSVIDRLGDDPLLVLEREPLMRLAADGELCVYEHEGFWQCADTVRDVKKLQALWDSGNPPWKVW